MELERRFDNGYTRKSLALMAQSELIERGLVQIIDEPTHRQNGLESKIDLIFTSEPRKLLKWGNLSTGSSHDCVWMTRRSKFVQKEQEFIKRSFKNFNKETLLDEARTTNFEFEGQNNEDEEELDARVEELQYKIRTLVDRYAPVKKFKIDPSKINWMTDDLKKRIEARNILKKKLDREGGNTKQWREWKVLRIR